MAIAAQMRRNIARHPVLARTNALDPTSPAFPRANASAIQRALALATVAQMLAMCVHKPPRVKEPVVCSPSLLVPNVGVTNGVSSMEIAAWTRHPAAQLRLSTVGETAPLDPTAELLAVAVAVPNATTEYPTMVPMEGSHLWELAPEFDRESIHRVEIH